ncbi:recombinase family protein [Nocardia fluminea]|uniref:recombinase family protein n=1 Tax=Nocardia fluminea TaxID=134984 RepID=UPI00365A4B21
MGTSPDIDVAFAGDDLVLRLSCAAYLARFSGTSRTHCGWDLRLYFARCVEHHASPLAMNRFQIERYVGWMQEVRRFKPSTVAPDSGCNRLLPHLCHRRCPGALTGRVHAAPASLERVTDVGAFAPAVRSTAERGTGLGQSVRLRARCLFTDRKSGKDTERAELWKCLEYMRAGDTLVVPSLDRLGRSLQDLISKPLIRTCIRIFDTPRSHAPRAVFRNAERATHLGLPGPLRERPARCCRRSTADIARVQAALRAQLPRSARHAIRLG